MSILRIASLLILVVAVGCSPNTLQAPEPKDKDQGPRTRIIEGDMSSMNSMTQDMSMMTQDLGKEDIGQPVEDMSMMVEDMRKEEDMKPPCVPLTAAQCGALCGMRSDGCGGMIDCGQCPPEDCDNGMDDDGDNLVDCDDRVDCGEVLHCKGTEICNNNTDDDGDGLADCQDIECRSFGVCDDGLGCNWRQITTRSGSFHTVSQATPQWSISPISATESFACLRVEFTMATANNLAMTAAQNMGCPLNSHIVSVLGQDNGPDSKALGEAFFQFMNAQGCTTGRQGLAVNNWVAQDSKVSAAFAPGKTYRVVLEIKPFVTELQLYENGRKAGPILSATLEGTNLQHSNNPKLIFGLAAIIDDEDFPYFGAVYSDLQVWGDFFATPSN